MKTHILLLIALASVAISPSTTAATIETNEVHFYPGTIAEGAPAELMHWGKLVGQWSTVEERFKTDGSGWEASKSADWDFFWAFNGWGIQDNYTSPPLSVAVPDESARQRGINLRIYDPEEKRWVLTWLTVKSSKPATFTAISSDEKIVMLADDPNPQGFYGRVTFFDITATTFEWKLEWSKDQQQWQEVYRIHGSRK
jgi:hypothetical protein